jgi:single-stranded-DNA-specific exonuclease
MSQQMNQFTQGCKYLWKVPAYNVEVVNRIASSYNLSFPVAQTLANRNFLDPQEIEDYLFSSFEKNVAHPGLLKDALKTVDRIRYAIDHKEPILICGDYDVDGITSSALMMICLLPLGAQVNFFLPHRVKDGYGLSTKIVERAARNNYKVIITVDNGITAFEPAQRAKELGIDLIITDHHRPHDHKPDAFAIVNPHQIDCPYPFKQFAGVGVGFKILSLLYEQYKKELPSKAYELLLLGTIADVVSLTGENRFWVRYGLQYVNNNDSYALNILKQNSNLTKPIISSTDIGFSITPQINALGRLEDPRQGVNFLIGYDKSHVQEVGTILAKLNEKRKEIERTIVAQIQQEIESGKIDLTKENIIMTGSDNWPPGVIGLVASRMVGLYGRPTLLFHKTKDGLAKGSCRSIKEFNLFLALQSAGPLLKQFGGHALAAGFALEIGNLPLLKAHLEERIAQQLTPFDLQPKLNLDAHLTLPDLTKKLVVDLQHLEPFGNENECPTFYVHNVHLINKPELLKDAHVKCTVFAEGIIKPVIFFNRPELYEWLMKNEQAPFNIAARVSENYWNGRTNIELIGTDIALHTPENT